MLVGVVGWIILGLIAGFIVSKFINLKGDDARRGRRADCVACLAAVLGLLNLDIKLNLSQ